MLDARRAAHPRGHLATRAIQLVTGLALFGFSLALMVRSGLGLGPWDVLHQGLSRRLGLPLGWVVLAVGALVLLAWVPLRQRPGPGTVANVAVVGAVVNGSLAVLPQASGVAAQVSSLVAGVLLNGVATGLYIGAGLGPGPRDGLMLGLARRGVPLMRARTLIELSVLVIGFVLGGTVGPGTVAYAFGIGPLAGFFVPAFTRGRRQTATRAHDAAGARTCGRVACRI